MELKQTETQQGVTIELRKKKRAITALKGTVKAPASTSSITQVTLSQTSQMLRTCALTLPSQNQANLKET